MDKDIIRSSSNPWAPPVLTVRQRSGKIRICSDYRDLNAKNRVETFPLPRRSDPWGRGTSFSWYFPFHLSQGCYQVVMDLADVEKTAFVTEFILFSYQRPLSLANVVRTFQRLMQSSMSDIMFSVMIAYLHNILVFTPH